MFIGGNNLKIFGLAHPPVNILCLETKLDRNALPSPTTTIPNIKPLPVMVLIESIFESS
jgi:hypothetical protein